MTAENNKLFIATNIGEIRIINSSTWTPDTSSLYHDCSVTYLCSNEKYLVSCDCKGGIKIWDIDTLELINHYKSK